MRKKRIDRDLIVLLVSTLVTMASWIGFEVYRTYMQVKIDPEVGKYLQEIDPTLNMGVFSKLEEQSP